MQILVIEDNRDILANVLDYLQLKGYSVDCAQDGVGGLHLACTGHYDLVIVLDIMLPGMRWLRGLPAPARRCPERGADPHAGRRDALEDRLKGLRAGADDYLLNPLPWPNW